MPHRSWELRISDIIEAIENVLEYSKGMTFEQFVADRKTIDAVVRNFIIIGEATSHLPEEFIKRHPDIPWREMRNIVVHEYFGVVMNLDEKILSDELLNYPKPCFVNLGTGVDGTIRELAEILRDTVGFNGEMVFDATKPDGTPQKRLDVSRMAGLGWRSSISLTEGIQRTYQWYLKRA